MRRPLDLRRKGVMRHLRNFGRNTEGVAFVEFAFIAPIMFLLMFGTIEFSQAITADRRITKISSSVADLIARVKEISASEVGQIFDIGDVLIQPYDTAPLSISVFNMKANENNASVQTVKWQCWNGKGTQAPAPGSLPTGIVEKGGEVIVVTVNYRYQSPISHYVAPEIMMLTETFYLKPRLGVVDLTSAC